jgi:hypothetical protein
MELEEIIKDFRDFKKTTEFSPIFVKGTDSYHRSIYDITERKINHIDAKLNELKVSNEEEYQLIVKQYLPTFIKILKSDFFVELYPFGSLIIEAHLEIVNPPSEIEIKSYIQRVSFLNESGVIDFLINRYPELKNNNSEFTYFLMQFLDMKYGTLQPIINSLRTNQTTNKNYPKPNKVVKSYIEKYKK